MKKNILIIFLLLVSATFVIYSYINANEAEKAKQEVTQLKIEATMLMDQSILLKERSLDEAANALKQQRIAEKIMEELLKCKSN